MKNEKDVFLNNNSTFKIKQENKPKAMFDGAYLWA